MSQDILRIHQPSEVVRARAKAGGIDLETLKFEDPQRYKMLNAQRIIKTVAPFIEDVCAVYWAAFPRYELFRLERPPIITLLSFPELTKAELRRWDDALGRMIALPHYQSQGAFYRVVNTLQGELRQLAVPLSPENWQGEGDVLIGPFASETIASHWAEENLGETSYAHDVFQQAGQWFCDVFTAPSVFD
jgi:hypothetical protein